VVKPGQPDVGREALREGDVGDPPVPAVSKVFACTPAPPMSAQRMMWSPLAAPAETKIPSKPLPLGAVIAGHRDVRIAVPPAPS
jgi:hypothetical protein